MVSTGVAVAPVASAVVAQLMRSPPAPVRGTVGRLLKMVGGQRMGALSVSWAVVRGQASLVGRLMASPLRERGTKDRLALGN